MTHYRGKCDQVNQIYYENKWGSKKKKYGKEPNLSLKKYISSY